MQAIGYAKCIYFYCSPSISLFFFSNLEEEEEEEERRHFYIELKGFEFRLSTSSAINQAAN